MLKIFVKKCFTEIIKFKNTYSKFPVLLKNAVKINAIKKLISAISDKELLEIHDKIKYQTLSNLSNDNPSACGTSSNAIIGKINVNTIIVGNKLD